MTKAEYRIRTAVKKEQERIEMKQRANQLRAQGYSIADIANLLEVSEGAIHRMVSVNGGF